MKSWQVYESMSRNKYARAAHPEKPNIKGSWLCRKQSLQPKRDVCTGRGMNRILSQVHFTNKFVQEIQNLVPLPKTGTDSWTRPSINQAPPGQALWRRAFQLHLSTLLFPTVYGCTAAAPRPSRRVQMTLTSINPSRGSSKMT